MAWKSDIDDVKKYRKQRIDLQNLVESGNASETLKKQLAKIKNKIAPFKEKQEYVKDISKSQIKGVIRETGGKVRGYYDKAISNRNMMAEQLAKPIKAIKNLIGKKQVGGRLGGKQSQVGGKLGKKK